MTLKDVFPYFIATASLLFSIYIGVFNMIRNKKQDTQCETKEVMALSARLEYLVTTLMDMKNDIAGIKVDIRNIWCKLTSVEERHISMEKRLEQVESEIKNKKC